jgi:hypothetical protein
MALIEFTLLDGNPVTVDTANLAFFQPSDGGTLIVLGDSAQIIVEEPYDTVATMLGSGESPPGC